MKNVFCMILLILITPLLSPFVLSGADSQKYILFSPGIWWESIWQVHADGKAIKLPFESPSPGGGILGRGQTHPMPSPDNQWVAYTQQNDLWFYEVSTEKRTRITKVGKPYDEIFSSILVYITGWSHASHSILYNVNYGDTECIDCLREDWKIPQGNFGFYIYNLQDKTITSVKLPGQYQGWVNENTILISKDFIDENGKFLEKLYLFNLIKSEETPVPINPSRFGHFDISPNGPRALGRVSKNGTSQIKIFELKTGNEIEVSTKGTFAQFQRPKFSPSEKKIAYRKNNSLVVAQKTIYTCTQRIGYFRFNWINDQALVVSCKKEFLILDSDAGLEKGRFPY